MNEHTRPTGAAQSFIIRLWQERPRQWRGTVRHVQSDAQRGFSQLNQAISFIEQRAAANPAPALPRAQTREQPSPQPRVNLSWLTARRLRPVYALAGLVALVVLTLLLVNPNSNVPLAGAAVGGAVTWELVYAFLIGLLLGGLGVGLYFRSRHA